MGVSRDAVASELASGLLDWGAEAIEGLRASMAEQLEAFGDGEIEQFAARMAQTGADWGYHPPDPVARQILRALLGLLIEPGSAIQNPEILSHSRDHPVLFLGNHLSYVDANAFEHLLVLGGHLEIADKLTTLAGPKVFTHPNRRLASLCFGTIKLPQSASRSSGEAAMSPREVAPLARRTFACARERLELGEDLLMFPEGSRSRSGQLERCLAAVARYLDEPDLQVVVLGHTGCEKLIPLGETTVQPSTVTIRFGAPVPAAELLERCQRRRQRVADVIGFLIADQLPEGYRGAYAGSAAADRYGDAREIANTLAP